MRWFTLLLFAISALPAEAQFVGTQSRIFNYRWTNAVVVAGGAATTRSLVIASIPARTLIERAYIVVTTQAAGATTLTASVGRTASAYTDLVGASNIKAAAATTYAAEPATIPSLSGATDVYIQFVSTGANLDQVTGSSGEVILILRDLPQAATALIQIDSPTQNQVTQRASAVSGSFTVSGKNTGPLADIEARFNGGAWSTIASAVGPLATFSGTLSGQTPGSGPLEVRRVYQDSAASVRTGLGMVFVVAGQSNASGFGVNYQTYTGDQVAVLFSNTYAWQGITDPTDQPVGQVDVVSRDNAGIQGAKGSVWIPVANAASADGVPVAFIPCALGGSPITAWLPGADHANRATLYGSMKYRASIIPGGVAAVLWWQGETDAINQMSGATYSGHLTTIANAISADLGVPFVVAKLQNCTGCTPNLAVIQAAQQAAWGVGNVVAGPDLSDMTTDDLYHLASDASLATAAGRWWTVLQAIPNEEML